MDGLEEKYKEFRKIGCMDYSRKLISKYRKLSNELLHLLKAEYLVSGDKNERIDRILQSLNEEESDPIKFWGSEKTADRNHYIYVADKETRLFESLRIWYEKRGAYEKS